MKFKIKYLTMHYTEYIKIVLFNYINKGMKYFI